MGARKRLRGLARVAVWRLGTRTSLCVGSRGAGVMHSAVSAVTCPSSDLTGVRRCCSWWCVAAQVEIDTVEKFEELRRLEQQFFVDMVQKCKDSGAGLVICQWGFDDEANHLLMHNDLPAVR